MMRAKGRYRNRTGAQLDQPLSIAEGTEVEIAIHLAEAEEVQGFLSLRSGQSWDAAVGSRVGES